MDEDDDQSHYQNLHRLYEDLAKITMKHMSNALGLDVSISVSLALCLPVHRTNQLNRPTLYIPTVRPWYYNGTTWIPRSRIVPTVESQKNDRSILHTAARGFIGTIGVIDPSLFADNAKLRIVALERLLIRSWDRNSPFYPYLSSEIQYREDRKTVIVCLRLLVNERDQEAAWLVPFINGTLERQYFEKRASEDVSIKDLKWQSIEEIQNGRPESDRSFGIEDVVITPMGSCWRLDMLSIVHQPIAAILFSTPIKSSNITIESSYDHKRVHEQH